MKNKILSLCTLCAGILAAGTVCSCSVDNADPGLSGNMLIELTTPPLSAPAEGGGLEITYRITNGKDPRTPVASLENLTADADQGWLHDFDCSAPGIVRFTADPNPGEAREATVTLTYPGADPATLPVSQEGKPASFAFALSDITSSGATIEVLPVDKNAYYTWDVMPRTEFDKQYADDAALVEEHLAYLSRKLEEYRNTVDAGATLVDILQRNDDRQRINVLDPDTEYILFAFGVDERGEATTDPARHTFSTAAFKVVDPCTFGIAFARVEQLQFGFTVTPSDNATHYYIGLSDAALLDDSSPEQVATDFIRRAEIAGIDWNAHDALRSGNVTLHTFDDLEIGDLKPDTEYSIVVFGVSTLGERTTAVAHAEVRTAAVPDSDMTFVIDVLETSVEGAIIEVTPSNNRETYMAGTIRKELYTAFADDRTFMEYVVEQGNVVLLDGPQKLDRTGALLTDTEYICFAFGYIGGITTPLTYAEFSTRAPETTGKAKVEIEIVAKTHPSYDVALYAYLTPNEYAEHWYAGAFYSEGGVIQVPFSGEVLTDAEVIQSLTTNENDNYWDTEYAACGATFGKEYTFCAIARDKEGKLGPLVKKTVVAEAGMLEP